MPMVVVAAVILGLVVFCTDFDPDWNKARICDCPTSTSGNDWFLSNFNCAHILVAGMVCKSEEGKIYPVLHQPEPQRTSAFTEGADERIPKETKRSSQKVSPRSLRRVKFQQLWSRSHAAKSYKM